MLVRLTCEYADIFDGYPPISEQVRLCLNLRTADRRTSPRSVYAVQHFRFGLKFGSRISLIRAGAETDRRQVRF